MPVALAAMSLWFLVMTQPPQTTTGRLKYYSVGPGLREEIARDKSHRLRVLSLAGSSSVHSG
jgi:hypothetical protein